MLDSGFIPLVIWRVTITPDKRTTYIIISSSFIHLNDNIYKNYAILIHKNTLISQIPYITNMPFFCRSVRKGTLNIFNHYIYIISTKEGKLGTSWT
jgi:hypothetical protein